MKKCILCSVDIIMHNHILCKKCHRNLLKKDSIRCCNCRKGRIGRCQCGNFVQYCTYCCGGEYCNIKYCFECI